ncbi:nuclear localization sequence-binding protein-like isoform X2 [Zerene cesonia]|uniref:nuclear localization sequence-binding protein-like isoform X2 n=1 Tax=Zerene cesonia TaxID=33412 RepID=UPI0018E4FC10|nr:nuclear localization sequence-binding protein-like isoform X2 [Zerene cesonia]
MVAPKRGRGAAQKKAKANEEVSQPEPEPTEAMEATEENNGDTQPEAQEEAPAGEEAAEQPEGEQEAQNTEEAKQEEPKEEKVEPGKLLVENLPPSYLFDYQDKLKELFSKHGEINSVKRGPIIVTELTTTPTLSAIVEFKNKECLEKALTEDGTVLEGNAISVVVESSAETAVLVGVPYEASTDYVKLLFGQCGEIAHIHEFSKTKFKILRVTFHEKESVEKALKLDRELRLNGFLVTVSKYRDDDEQKAHANSNKSNKRQHGQQGRNSAGAGGAGGAAGAGGAGAGGAGAAGAGAGGAAPPRNNSFRPRGAAFNARGNFRGGARGRGFAGRGGAFPRGGFAPVNTYLPPQGFMGRPGAFMNDGQRPNKRLRQM